jgi:ribA/ribD-fused uncharacterized protein
VLESTPATREGGPRSVSLKLNLRNDSTTEDIFTGYMRELRDNPGTNELYNNLVKVAILQGMYKSPISIGNIIPIEDYSKSITPIITGLRVDNELQAYTQGWFQRNNFRDSSIFTRIEPKFRVGAWSGPSWDPDSVPTVYYSTQYFPTIETYNIASSDRKILTLSETYNYQGTRSDYVQFARGLEVTKGGKPTGDMIDVKTGKPLTKNQIRLMREKGDESFKDLYNYQRVRNADGSPFYIFDKGDKMHVYKLINVYGDGNLVHEYYDSFKPSPFKNGTVQVKEELTDDQVRNALSFKADTSSKAVTTVEIKPVQKTETQPVVDSSKKINIYAGTKENAELSNFADRPFEIGGVKYNSVEQAFQHAKLAFADTNDRNMKIASDIMKANGATAKSLGQSFVGFDRAEWDAQASSIMKTLLKQSFEQNPEALEKLLATGNAELTHTQDKGKWGKEFPKLLMEVREELGKKSVPSQSEEVRYADKDKRIRIEYPSKIKTNVADFDTNKLLEIQKVFTGVDDGTVADQRKFAFNNLTGYGMTDTEYAYAKNNEDILNNLLEVANTSFEDIYYDNIPDVVTRLLKDNEKLVDTAQTSLFNTDNLNLEGGDLPTTC